VADLFRPLVDEIRASCPDLLIRHDYELLHVLPELSASIATRPLTLTESSRDDEKVRNFPADRAYRVAHGLIHLLQAFKGEDPAVWVIACDGLDEAGHLGRRFFRELMRRRGKHLRLALLATCLPGKGEELAEFFAPTKVRLLEGDFPGGVSEVDPAEIAEQALKLECRVGRDRKSLQTYAPTLIRLWNQAGRPDKVFEWQRRALWLYPVLGYYEDALTYAAAVIGSRNRFAPDDDELSWLIFIKNYYSLLALRRVDQALALAQEQEAQQDALPPSKLCQVYYLLAMLHSRYLPKKDLDLAEKYLERGITEIEKIDPTSTDVDFLCVFNRNGLAFVRHLQGQPREAIELCRSGYERLIAKLDPEDHHLHKSVLIYNIAQVYAAIGEPEEAITYYTTAMDMDPNYSEYYNERGNLLLSLGRLEEARRDYLSAIKLSAPYPEVHANLGQCYRMLGLLPKAVEEYSLSLDLQPDQLLALLGRAQSYEGLGQSQQAIADYDAVLALKPDQWEALANRATLHYEAGRLEACAMDLTQAIALAPQNPDLYLNRSILFEDSGRITEAIADLESSLRLQIDPVGVPAIEARLRDLQNRSALLSQ
jgi:tetratricopeptide (TPR) repeat protein